MKLFFDRTYSSMSWLAFVFYELFKVSLCLYFFLTFLDIFFYNFASMYFKTWILLIITSISGVLFVIFKVEEIDVKRASVYKSTHALIVAISLLTSCILFVKLHHVIAYAPVVSVVAGLIIFVLSEILVHENLNESSQ